MRVGRVLRIFAATICAALLPATSPAAPLPTMRAHFIDVGQGAATLIEFPCAAMLIDTGGEQNAQFAGTTALMDYLDTFFASRPHLNKTLSSLILTHPHKDHTLGVPAVLARYKVLNAITNGMQTGSGRFGQATLHNKVAESEEDDNPSTQIGFVAAWVKDIPANTGLTSPVIDPISCPTIDPKITLLWGQVENNLGWNKKTFENENNHSVAVRIDFDKSSMLLSGDLEEAALAAFVKRYKGTPLLAVDVIQVNHHGSHNGTTVPLLEAAKPKIAVMQMGSPDRRLDWTAWAYGHPRKQAVDLLQQRVSSNRAPMTVQVATGQRAFISQSLTRAIYGTGWEGAIVLEANTNGDWRAFDGTPGPRLLDLNRATVDDLIALPLIGPARAKAIVDYRDANGPFQDLEDLKKVPRIKAGTINAIKNLVQVQ